jgi:Spy/CpxP family protein refolding chaperone
MRIAKVLFASAFAAALVCAQGPHNAPDPTTMVAHHVDHLTKFLTLTAAQQQQATTIFTSAATANSTARASLKTARQALSDAVKSNNTAAIDQAASTIGTLTAQIASSDGRAEAAFIQILTPDQQTKLSQVEGEGRGHFGGVGGGPGPDGFRRGRQ